MRISLTLIALTLAACASSQSHVASPSTTQESAAPASATAEAPRIKPGSPFVGEAAGKNNQYCRGKVSKYLDDGGGKQRAGETIDRAKCAGTEMQHAAWCHDDKTMIVCEGNVFYEVDCAQVVPSGVCGVLPNGGGSLDCVAP